MHIYVYNIDRMRLMYLLKTIQFWSLILQYVIWYCYRLCG